jgi:uncharacterized protein (DUF58 family)
VLTKQGLIALIGGVAALVVGRVFGVVELFVIGAAFLVAVGFGFLYVTLRWPKVDASRWIHPAVLVAGETGRIDLQLRHTGALPSAGFILTEPVQRTNTADHVAQLAVAPMRANSEATAGYQLPTSMRGLIEVGPLSAEIRDPLGVARRQTAIAGTDSITVAPRAHLLDVPRLGSGPLGRHLLAQARRLGPGDFHSLREYVDGDEPRSIHWRASARADGLLVKQHSIEGLRRMIVVLDSDPASYVDGDSYERAITAAASLVRSAQHNELATRFVTNGGVDLRGPEVTGLTLRLLAEIEPTIEPFGVLDHDPGEGVGLLVVVTGRRGSSGWRAVRSVIDPTVSIVPVTTDESSRSAISVTARSDQEFLRSWATLVGASGHRRGSSSRLHLDSDDASAVGSTAGAGR